LILERDALQRSTNSLLDKPTYGQPRKYTEKHVAEIFALACILCPTEARKWLLTLLTDELRKKAGFETIIKKSIRLILKKQN
jgi:putative transposase